MSYSDRLPQAVFTEPHLPLVQDSSENQPGDKKKRGHVFHIAATAGPLPHHQPSTSGISSQEGSCALNPDVSGKHASSKGFAGTLHSMSARE